jgi:hypothetical protein
MKHFKTRTRNYWKIIPGQLEFCLVQSFTPIYEQYQHEDAEMLIDSEHSWENSDGTIRFLYYYGDYNRDCPRIVAIYSLIGVTDEMIEIITNIISYTLKLKTKIKDKQNENK